MAESFGTYIRYGRVGFKWLKNKPMRKEKRKTFDKVNATNIGLDFGVLRPSRNISLKAPQKAWTHLITDLRGGSINSYLGRYSCETLES